MDQIKIGKFIAELRKEKSMTQEQLAERLGVSNRSVSRWENGKNLPDISLFAPVCEIFEITVSELIEGERFPKENLAAQSELTAVKTVKAYSKAKKKSRVILSLLLVVVAIFGVWQGIQIYEEKKGVRYYKNIFTYDKNVVSVLNETENFIKSKTGHSGFVVDEYQPFTLITDRNKAVEYLYFTGSTEESEKGYYFSICSSEKSGNDRLQIFSGELDEKGDSLNGTPLSELITMLDSFNPDIVLPKSTSRFILELRCETLNCTVDDIAAGGTPVFITENGTTRKAAENELLCGKYSVLYVFQNEGECIATVCQKSE